MEILWFNDDTAHVESREQTDGNANTASPECLTWQRIEGDNDSHMAKSGSSQIVITGSDGQYWVSIIFGSGSKQRHADQDIGHVDSLDAALIQATTWALATIARFNANC